MKKIFILFLIFGCNPFSDPISDFHALKPPILLVGKSDDGTVTVCDKMNSYVTIGCTYYLARSISASYEVGDTLLFFHTD